MTDLFAKERAPRVTVDAWILDRKGRLLLVKRGRAPFKGSWSLPGGFCEWGETTEAACAREAEEETGVHVRVGELLGVYSDPRRDPRGHTITVLYAARPIRGELRGADDATEARWFAPADAKKLDLAFDHARIIREQLARPVPKRPGAKSRPGRRGAAPE